MDLNGTDTCDVVVVGAGIAGVSTAFHLAERGMDVTVVEKEPVPACGSSGKSAGGIRGQFATPHDLAASMYSIPFYETFEERFGGNIEYKRYGYLFLASREETLETYRRRLDTEKKYGTGTLEVTPSEISELVGGLETGGIAGGTFNPRDGYLDPHAVVMGFIKAAREYGAKFRYNERVVSFEHAEGRVAGVVTDKGNIHSESVVLCAGPWTGKLAELEGVALPLSPRKRQVFVTGPFDGLAADAPFVINEDESFYFRRELGGVLMSAMETEPTDDFDPCPDWSSVEGLAHKAVKSFPAFVDAGFETAWAGVRTLTPDGSAILGPTSVDGLYVACGFSGHGFCHGPATGAILADAVTLEPLSGLYAEPFRYDRFRA